MCIGGTYGGIVAVIDAYQNGDVSQVFSCADNSNTVST